MPNAKIKLLIVDDDPSIVLLMSQIFTELGHSVRSAQDGLAALLEIRQEMPDVILSDLNMPGMSGFEFLSVVRRRFPSIYVIAMSGAFLGDSMQVGIAADHFYEKATNLSFLLQIMEAATQPEQLAASRKPTSTPIWIPSNGHDPAGEEYVVITCPECLRTFPQVLARIQGFFRETSCVYCKNLIPYAIVQLTDPAAPQAFQRKPVTEVPLSLSKSDFN